MSSAVCSGCFSGGGGVKAGKKGGLDGKVDLPIIFISSSSFILSSPPPSFSPKKKSRTKSQAIYSITVHDLLIYSPIP